MMSHTASPAVEQPTSRFFSLPAELRNLIYEYTFAPDLDQPIDIVSACRPNPGIVLACRQTYVESAALFAAANKQSRSGQDFAFTLGSITPEGLKSILRDEQAVGAGSLRIYSNQIESLNHDNRFIVLKFEADSRPLRIYIEDEWHPSLKDFDEEVADFIKWRFTGTMCETFRKEYGRTDATMRWSSFVCAIIKMFEEVQAFSADIVGD